MAGAADLVAALTGGDKLEQDAYSQAAQRIASAQAAQSLMDKRVQEAYALKKQNETRDRFGNVFASVVTNRPEGQIALSNNELATLVPMMLAGGYGTANDAISALETLNQAFGRQATVAGAQQMNYRPDVVGALAFDPKQAADIGTVEKVGDLLLTGNRSENPQVEAIMTALNAKTAAASDKSGRGTENERKIQAIMQRINPETNAPYTRQEAEDRVWFEDINVNAVTGQPFLENTVTQQISPLELTNPGGDKPAPTVPSGQTFYDLAGKATGPANMASDLWARASSLVGGNPDFGATQAIENVTVNLQQIIRGLSISDRNPVTEQERLLEWIKLEPGWLTSPATFKARVTGANNALRAKLEASKRDAADYTLPPQLQKAAQQDVRTVTQALNVLGHPDWRMENLPPALVEGVRSELMAYPTWNKLSEADRNELVLRTALERSESGY